MENEKRDIEYLIESKKNLIDLLSWSNEIPDEFFETAPPEYSRYKYRSIWISGVISNVSLVADITNDVQLKSDADNFVVNRKARGLNPKTTKEEIDFLDSIVHRALKNTENI